MPDRYSTAGLAHSAADALTASTGEQHRMAFEPRPQFTGSFDPKPFVVVRDRRT